MLLDDEKGEKMKMEVSWKEKDDGSKRRRELKVYIERTGRQKLCRNRGRSWREDHRGEEQEEQLTLITKSVKTLLI